MQNGIICKVWNIQGKTNTKNASSQIKDSIGYILNDEKVDITLSMKGRPINDPASQLGRECKYVENDVKTVEGAFVGTRNLISSDIKQAVSEMMDVKNFYEKTDGRAALHGIISLPESESDIKNAASLMKLCEEVMAEVFPNNQVIFAVHTNTENLHIHFIVNSVGLDGKKIHQDDKFMRNVLHPCVNKYAKKYGFTVNEKWKKNEKPEKDIFIQNKIMLRNAIDRAIEKSDDFEGFVDHLRKENLIVNVGVHISLRDGEMKKAIRTHQLGPNYTKDAIVERIFTRKEAFQKSEISSVTSGIGKTSVSFHPEYNTMKQYKSMNPDEKEYVLKQLRLGKNPWRIHKRMNWQLNEIANELNKRSRVQGYVSFYARNDGTLEGTTEQILNAKRIISEDKKRIKEQIRRYKPILDIYEEMRGIERKAYLYEHENAEEFRMEFDQYRNLTKRLKDGYNKTIDEVSAFLQECDDRFLYADGQLKELSEEYREIKQYAKEQGIHLNKKNSLSDQIGMIEAKNDAKHGLFEADAFILVSKSSDVMLRVVKTPYVNEKGKTVESASLTLTTKYGEIIEQYDTQNGMRGYYEFLNKIERQYGLTDPVRVRNAAVAREYIAETEKTVFKETDSEEKNKEVKKDNKYYSFTQAVNLQSVKNEDGIHVIMNANNPSFMAVIQSSEHSIIAKIIDSKGKQCGVVEFPSLKDRSNDGFEVLSTMQKEYGFTDEMVAYSNLDEAKQHMKKQNNKREDFVPSRHKAK